MNLKFKLKIGADGSFTEINEPYGFDAVSFVIERNKDYYGLIRSASGNNGQGKEYSFNYNIHDNVFNDILKEYDSKGFIGVVVLQVLNDTTVLFEGLAKLSSAITDGKQYLNCQFIENNNLYDLEYKKGIKTDLLQEPSVATNKYMLRGIEVPNESSWIDESVGGYNLINQNSKTTFNNIGNVKKEQIRDTLSWLEWGKPYINHEARHKFMAIRANSELRDIKVAIKTAGSIISPATNGKFRAYVAYGGDKFDRSYDEWFDGLTVLKFIDVETRRDIDYIFGANGNTVINIPYLGRGQGIWIWFEYDGLANYKNNQNTIDMTAISRDFNSKITSIKLKDALTNVVKKNSKISGVEFPNDDYWNNNHIFNGNLLRDDLEKPFTLDWEFCKNTLKECGYGYTFNNERNVIEIKQRDEFYLNKKITEFDNTANNELEISTDEDFVKNSFSYKFKSYQSQKENEMEGNAKMVHGSGQWYIDNENVEGEESVSLQFSRDGYLIEEQRIKAFKISDNTSTNEDNNVFMIDSSRNYSTFVATENIYLNTRFNAPTNRQVVANNGEFSFKRIGLEINVIVRLDGMEYIVMDMSDSTMDLVILQGSPQLNTNKVYSMTYTVSRVYVSDLKNGLLNLNYSLRSNVLSNNSLLGAYNFYTNKEVINKEYIGDGKMLINGYVENEPINTDGSILKPKKIVAKVNGTIEQFNNIFKKEHGFIRVFDHNRVALNILPNNIASFFINNCAGDCTFEIEGNLLVDYNIVVIRDYLNDNFEGQLYFEFNDEKQTVTILNKDNNYLFVDKHYRDICSDSTCFSEYVYMKQYLTNLYN